MSELTEEVLASYQPEPRVLSKKQFYSRFANGEFGSGSISWDTVDEALAAHDGLFGVRSHAPWSKCAYHVPPESLQEVVAAVEAAAAVAAVISPMADHSQQLINAEIQRIPQGLYLRCSFLKEPMRPSLEKAGEHYFGLRASQLLRANSTPEDYDWLMQLMDNYPSAVIEFTTFRKPQSCPPYSNMIVWEVRDY